MKLKLEKKQVVSLSSLQMESVNGGGIKRSNRRTGNCAYSRKNPDVCTCSGKVTANLVVGCVAAAKTKIDGNVGVVAPSL